MLSHLRIDPTMPSPAFSKLSSGLARRHASLLVQLRTGHIVLQKHMHRIGKADSPTCPACRGADESVHQFLFYCPKYKEQRNDLRTKMQRGASCIRTLLSKQKTMTPLFKYIHDMRRFTNTFSDLTIPEEKRKEN